MKVKVTSFVDPFFSVCSSSSPPHRHQSPSDPILLSLPRLVSKSRGVEIKSVARGGGGGGGGGGYLSAWDDKSHELLPGGKRAYFDEFDVVTFLDPHKELIPLDPSSYNPSAYLCMWMEGYQSVDLMMFPAVERVGGARYILSEKIRDIPDERRHRLLRLLQPRLVSRVWELAGTRFEDAILAKKTASHMLSGETGLTSSVEYYNCRTSGGRPSISWMKFFKKAIFCDSDQKIYGRCLGNSMVARVASSSKPLYFAVRQVKEAMSTEQPCDLAYEFGDGHWNLNERPEGFPKPERHPHPFDDEVVVYVRYIGPGILIGQAWQEGKELQQLPQKLCGNLDGERLRQILCI